MLQNSEKFSSFSVDDIKKARYFYENVLGLNLKDDPMGHIEMRFSNEHSMILYPKPNHEPATFTVLNFMIKDIEKAVNELSGKGVKFLQYEAPIKTDKNGICWSNEGPNIAWFKDPAGNILSLIEQA